MDKPYDVVGKHSGRNSGTWTEDLFDHNFKNKAASKLLPMRKHPIKAALTNP